MSLQDRVLQALRGLGRSVPTSVRMPLGRATRRLRRLEGPLVTVVLAISDRETSRISVCLDTLRDQTHRNIEVLVVRYDDSTRSGEVAAGHAAGDWRIRILRQVADSQASARNLGRRRARGDYVLFVNGGDDLPRTGIEHLVEALEASGSDFAVGKMDQPLTVNRSVDSPFEAAHRHDLAGVTLALAPIAITDLGLGNRLFRRTFLERAELDFAEGPAGAVRVAVESYRCGTFDLLHQATYVPTARRDGVSVGAVPPVLDGLDDWVSEQRSVATMIAGEGLSEVRRLWLAGILDHELQTFLDDVERATDDQWESLREVIESLSASADEDPLEGEPRVSTSSTTGMRAESKVKIWLARHDRREQLADYVAARWFELGHRPTVIEDGRVFAQLPFFDDPDVGVPRECFEMPAAHTPLRVEAREVRWRGRTLEIVLFVRIDYVGFDGPPDVAISLMPDDGSEPIPLRIQQRRDPELNHAQGHRYQDYAEGSVSAFIEPDQLTAGLSADKSRKWSLHVSLGVRGIHREGGVGLIDPRASAGMLGTGHIGTTSSGAHRVGIRPAGSGLELHATPDNGIRLRDVLVSGRSMVGRVEPAGHSLTEIVVAMGDLRASSRLLPSPDGLRFSLEVPPRWAESTRLNWQVTLLDTTGCAHAPGWVDDAQLGVAQAEGHLAPVRSSAGDLELLEAQDLLVADRIVLEDGAVKVEAHWLGLPPRKFELRLKGATGTFAGAVTKEAGSSRITAEFPMVWDPWGLGESAVPCGRYYFELSCGPATRQRRGRVWLSVSAASSLFRTTHTDDYTFRVIRMGPEAGVFLRNALADDDRGPHGQARLQAAYAENRAPLDDQAFYLQSYSGATATDSQLAIHHELRRTHPELRLYWGVREAASQVPEGGIPVLMHSPEWYDVMATARHLCLNIDVDRWFHARPGQRLLQTFHGYPAKSMGIRMWEAKGYTPRRIAMELARTSKDWDLILTPSPEMDVHYRVEYAYEGPIHSRGYPRDDALVAPGKEHIRQDTRRRLGIQPHHKVVLYAPTWRDDLAVNWREARMVQHLDLDAAARALGPDYVFLLRGHRFNAAVDRSAPTSEQLIDVTGYPEINDLILAADAAVLDYSSLRFDFSLTGRPMVFLVPDLADYVGGVRGFLFDYRDTAPGPLVATGAEVVDQLRDLEALQQTHAAAYKTFDQRFNRYMDGHAAERVVAAFMPARDGANDG